MKHVPKFSDYSLKYFLNIGKTEQRSRGIKLSTKNLGQWSSILPLYQPEGCVILTAYSAVHEGGISEKGSEQLSQV